MASFASDVVLKDITFQTGSSGVSSVLHSHMCSRDTDTLHGGYTVRAAVCKSIITDKTANIWYIAHPAVLLAHDNINNSAISQQEQHLESK